MGPRFFFDPDTLAKNSSTIKIFGGMRDDKGVSRICWVDVATEDPRIIKNICKKPALDIGQNGMFDDTVVILGNVMDLGEHVISLCYIGFQIVANAKF